MEAKIVSSFSEMGFACLAIRVDEPWGSTEYIGRVPMDDNWLNMTAAKRLEALMDAAKMERQKTIGNKSDTISDLDIPETVKI